MADDHCPSHAALAASSSAQERIESLFAEVEPRQSRSAYVYTARGSTISRYLHFAFDSNGIKEYGATARPVPDPQIAAAGLVNAVTLWAREQPLAPDRRRLVWRKHPEVMQAPGRGRRYIGYCRLALVPADEQISFPEDEEGKPEHG